jgi:cyclophilin family peptidyl-prolyl cis-trans isomerase
LPLHLLISHLRILAGLALLGLGAAAARAAELPDGLYAEITTPRGVITCALEYARAPLTVANFVGLAEGTLGPAPRKPFFDGLTFHRVVPGFVIQGGDPLNTGEGGPGYTFADEFVPGLGHDDVGVLSMANDGPDTNGSQFFLTLAPVERLNYLHAVFGRTVGGRAVLAQVVQGDAMTVRIRRIGAAARAFRADDAAFAALQARVPRYSGAKEPGPRAHFDDPDHQLPADPPRAVNFNFKLTNYERATGGKIYARVYAAFTPGPLGDTPEAFTAGLAKSLGLADDGVLAVYFAGAQQWCLAVAPSRARWFDQGLAGSRYSLRTGPNPAQIAEFLAQAQRRAARYALSPTPPLTTSLQIKAQKIKVSVDAVLDELLLKPIDS